MLRHRPSLEFSPPETLRQSTALVPYEPQAVVVTEQSFSGSGEDDNTSDPDTKPTLLHTRLKAILDMVQKANEPAAGSVRFMRQEQNEREMAEALIKDRKKVAISQLSTCHRVYANFVGGVNELCRHL